MHPDELRGNQGLPNERGTFFVMVAKSPSISFWSKLVASSRETGQLDSQQSSEQPPKQQGPSIFAIEPHFVPAASARSMTLSVGVKPPPYLKRRPSAVIREVIGEAIRRVSVASVWKSIQW